jgi:hypothetical protein
MTLPKSSIDSLRKLQLPREGKKKADAGAQESLEVEVAEGHA